MIDWARARRRGWRARSRHAQVEASTRWSLMAVPWIMAFAGLPQALLTVDGDPLPVALVVAIAGCALTACAVSSLTLLRALKAYLGTGPVPRAGLLVLAVLLAVLLGLALALTAIEGPRDGTAEAMVLFAGVTAFLGPYALAAPVRTVWSVLAGFLAVAAVAFGALGMGWHDVLALVLVMVIGALAAGFATRCSGWYIAVLRELHEGREAQARLAVAEERLRFGRDMHDVVGRNLSVIALKSELAVQLVRRGSEAAVDQMVEVQRIARDSQREVREVVRGYREADLRTELAGARGILEAAGIACRTDDPGTDAVAEALPEPVRAALGWVVREGTTNVLRHADATHCTVTLRGGDGSTVLTMENDGAPHDAPAPDGGSGLTGLRERLAALGGTLTARRLDGALFRLTVEIPAVEATRRGAPTTGGGPPERPGPSAGPDGHGAAGPPAARRADEGADGRGDHAADAGRSPRNRAGNAPETPTGPASDATGTGRDAAGEEDGGDGPDGVGAATGGVDRSRARGPEGGR